MVTTSDMSMPNTQTYAEATKGYTAGAADQLRSTADSALQDRGAQRPSTQSNYCSLTRKSSSCEMPSKRRAEHLRLFLTQRFLTSDASNT